jgi:hypothetical protein
MNFDWKKIHRLSLLSSSPHFLAQRCWTEFLDNSFTNLAIFWQDQFLHNLKKELINSMAVSTFLNFWLEYFLPSVAFSPYKNTPNRPYRVACFVLGKKEDLRISERDE